MVVRFPLAQFRQFRFRPPALCRLPAQYRPQELSQVPSSRLPREPADPGGARDCR